ncbi:hypothetical protein F2Q70_00004549 [Brassica cretica]|uniref:Uncharacterized protein n=2 Tax=Brassica cretica TaxID=69181 RepID=A0ABQ7DB49_BRACR|nr:hypothetical protein F2Q68_00021405 [Brassica cretica]KAF2573094.1 hypothetical protein F2Q70_00004549 [Brassica cretica]KAF3563610.1 hypothetical protein DY000_02016630 [Brassica cretica]KAF3569481.1 hypothetical protein DY000_02016627 [Brassica cretica]
MNSMQSRERSYEDEVKTDSGRPSSVNGRAESAFDPARPFTELDLVQLGRAEFRGRSSLFDSAN